MSLIALSELLGASVRDPARAVCGRVREIAVAPEEHGTRVAYMIVKTAEGERILPAVAVKSCGATVRAATEPSTWDRYVSSDGVLLLKRDLLDQQIIDVHGRKVVRVNDVELDATPVNSHITLTVVSPWTSAPGARFAASAGASCRRSRFARSSKRFRRASSRGSTSILETDPARRVKLKIAYEGLSKLHPADIADIVEDLSAAEREAVFETIDEGVAAEALEEIEPDIQVSIVESLDSNRAADIVEEMDPDAAADLLGDLSEDRSGEILKEMEPEERQEVSDLLAFGEHTAAGRMTTEFIAVPETAVVDDAIDALKAFEGSREAVATIYLTGPAHRLVGAVPLVKIAVSLPTIPPLRAERAVHRLRAGHAAGRGRRALRQIQPHHARRRRRARPARRHHHRRRRDHDAAQPELRPAMRIPSRAGKPASRSSWPSSGRESSPPTSTTTRAESTRTRWPARGSATACCGR